MPALHPIASLLKYYVMGDPIRDPVTLVTFRVGRHDVERPKRVLISQKYNSPPGSETLEGCADQCVLGEAEDNGRTWVPWSGSLKSPPVTGGTWASKSGRILLGTDRGSQGEIPGTRNSL